MRPSAQVRSTHSSRSAGPGPPSVPTDSDGAPRSCGSRRSAVRSGRNGTRTVLRGRHVTWTSTSASCSVSTGPFDEPCLPDPRVTDDEECPGPARAGVLDRGADPAHLAGPADETPARGRPDRCGHHRSVTARCRARHAASEGSGGPFSGVSPDVAQGRWAGPWRSQHTATSREIQHVPEPAPGTRSAQHRSPPAPGRRASRVRPHPPRSHGAVRRRRDRMPGSPSPTPSPSTRASAPSSGSVRSSPAATTTPGTGCRHLPGSPSGEPTRHPPGGPGPQWSGAVRRVLSRRGRHRPAPGRRAAPHRPAPTPPRRRAS